MAGTTIGGAKCAKTNKAKYGENYYKNIGSIGGKAKVPKGFALMDAEKLSEVSRKGGRISRRGMGIKSEVVEIEAETVKKPFWSSLLYRSR